MKAGITMEREKELPKLVNVLRRTSRMALQSEWTGGNEDAAAYCVDQYNRVLARLKEIDNNVGTLFEPLSSGSSLTVVAMACRQLAAYFEDETGPQKGFGRAYGIGFDPEVFRDFWQKSSREFEDLGEFIRECIDEWARVRKGKKDEPGKSAGQSGQGPPVS
jgi:hypothetical protein